MSERRLLALVSLLAAVLSGCGGGPERASAPARQSSFEATLREARGQQVRWWMFGGDERVNDYVEVVVIFDGSGVKWVAELADEGHKYHGLLEEVRDVVAGACVYCSRAYAVKDEVEAANIPFLDDFRGHPSLRSLVAGGHQIITF